MTRDVADTGTRFFFIHVMKTGGTTFVHHIDSNFGPHERYPCAKGPGRLRQYRMVEALREFEAARTTPVRIYYGHFPFFASTLVDVDVRMTILRHPLDRTVSALRHYKRYVDGWADAPLEAIYEDELVSAMHLRNYQTKLFSMEEPDDPESHLDALVVDDRRLAVAVANLEKVDLLGLTERYPAFLDELSQRFGWRIHRVASRRVSTEDWDLPAGFERRILDDNAADLAFYEHAAALQDRRSANRAW